MQVGEITIFKAFNETSAGYNRSVEFILNRIKTGQSRLVIEQIRLANPLTAAKLKKSLPAILFSGTFRQRNAASIIEHSGLICLDFDGYATTDELNEARRLIIEDAYTYSVFVSPSGNGLKVLVKIPKDIKQHKLYFDSLREYYNDRHFDIHCSDICRICFESYDPGLFINTNSLVWDKINQPDLYTNETPNIAIPIRSENQIVQNLLKWFAKYSMAPGERNSNLYKLASSMNDYGVNKNEAERVCLNYATADFGEREIQSIVKSAYGKTANFNTKFFEDTFTKQKIEQQIRGGSDYKTISKSFPELTESEIENAVHAVKENISVTDFWEYTAKGSIFILHNKFKYFLQERSFFKYYPSGGEGFIFIKIHENLIEETNKDQIKDYVLNYLEHAPEIGIKPFNFMAEKTKYFSADSLSLLDTKEVTLLEDTVDFAYLYFQNKIIRVQRDSITEIDYINSDGYLWRKQIIPREYKPTPSKDCVFSKLIFYIANQETERYDSIRSVIGYLLHSFKTSANNKAIILNDETISDTPNGGSGKGLFWNALSHMKKLNSLDGKTFSFGDQFKYQTVSTDCQILVFDDVKNNFDFESLFSLITEGITIERKGLLAIKLPVKRSPKILITTNYTIGGVGGSFDRRKFEVEFSSFFNANNTPLKVFGHLIFDEWSMDEWSRFDNFMIECVQYYLCHGLVSSPFKNLEVRKFISKTSSEFYDFINEPDNIPQNVRIYSSKLYTELMEEYPDLRKWLTQRRLKIWVDTYAIYKGLQVERGKDVMGRYFILHDGSKPVQEVTESNVHEILPF